MCEPALGAYGPYKPCKSMSRVGRDAPPLCAETPKPKLQILHRMEKGSAAE